MLKGLFCFIFAETVGFHIIFGSLKRYYQLNWCFHYRLFCFRIGFLFCTASIGVFITYDITELIGFIKSVHQIFHCHTALPQMGPFLVTDLSQIFFHILTFVPKIKSMKSPWIFWEIFWFHKSNMSMLLQL